MADAGAGTRFMGTFLENDDLSPSYKEWLLCVCVQGTLYHLRIHIYDARTASARIHDDALDLTILLKDGVNVRFDCVRREIREFDGYRGVYLACHLLSPRKLRVRDGSFEDDGRREGWWYKEKVEGARGDVDTIG